MALIQEASRVATAQMFTDRVLVKRDEKSPMSPGGIHLPDSAVKESSEGTVVMCGPGTKDEPMRVTPRCKVIFGKYAGTEVLLDGEKHVVIRQEDILIAWPAE